MIEQLVELVLNESKWMATAMSLSLLAVLVQARRQQRQSLSGRGRILAALNLFYGCVIGIMAFGHLLAVSIKAVQGTLEGSPWLLYPIGVVLAVPSWWLTTIAGRLARDDEQAGKRAVALNGWLAVSLVALGPHNLPLAVPAAWNIGYHYHSRRAVGWTLLTVASAAYLALFVGSVIFFASGQSFEQFQGLE